MVSKKDFEKMIAAMEDRIDKRFSSLRDELGLKFDAIILKIDAQRDTLDRFVQRMTAVEERVEGLESALGAIEQHTIPDLQKISSDLRDKLTSLDLSTRMNNIIVSCNNQSNIPQTYPKILASLTDRPTTMPTPLSSHSLRNKSGNCIGLRLIFSNSEDRRTVTDLIVKTGKQGGITYRDDLPAVLTTLKNKLLVERRLLLSAGTGCYIRTSLRPPFLTLVQTRPKM